MPTIINVSGDHMESCVTYILLLLTVASSTGTAAPGSRERSSRNQVPTSVTGVSWAKRALQGFNLKVWLSNQMVMGIEAWDPYGSVPAGDCSTSGIGMEYPAGSCVEYLFGFGPMIGGIINGVAHVSSAYATDNAQMEFLPEKGDTLRDKIWSTHLGDEEYHPANDGYSGYYYNHGIVVNRRGFDDDGDGRVDEDELDGQDNDGDWNPLTDDVGRDGLPDSIEASCNGRTYDPVTNPDPAADNFDPASFDSCHPISPGLYRLKNDRNIYTEHNQIPDHGEPHVDEDYGAVSDNDLSAAATDTFRSTSVPAHYPMGIKIFQKTYAWRDDQLSSFIPMEYIFTNVGTHTVDSVYIGFAADFDIGPVSAGNYYANNYACYSEAQRCGYVGTVYPGYQNAGGIVLLSTSPPVDSLSYIWWWQDLQFGNIDSVMYRWMKGEPSGQLIKPCQSPSSPADTRFHYTFGPFPALKPGDTVRISAALVAGASVEDMLSNAQKAHDFYAENYTLGVPVYSRSLPSEFRIEQNHPNPFNPSTTIEYQLPATSHVRILIFNILGQLVATLADGVEQPGIKTVEWNASSIGSGVYFCRMEASSLSGPAESFVAVRKLVLTK